ncbi:MAG: M23 family metallopeptidase [Candidatus Competibacteraceae bacterium]|jgi:murein DD-endopeptidase MepM/ murein hydrolase activator NlpD|nr:M23 family metallopeptidase [Candidatus Competibacteraceae bacterium]
MSNELYKQKATTALKGQLWNPLPGNRGIGIGIDYGLVRKRGGGHRNHRGIDMHAPQNGTRDKVYAPADGRVVHAGWLNRYYGNVVQIHHVIGGCTVWTIMAHCRQVIVRNGQTVQGNQHIAWEGNTGNSDGVHVHFEIRVGRNDRNHTVDPVPTFKTNSAPRPLFFSGAYRRIPPPSQAEMDKIANKVGQIGQKMLKQQEEMLNKTFKQSLADLDALEI